MNNTPLLQIQFWFREAHSQIIKLVEGLTDEQLAWQPHPDANSIAFYVWHLARGADFVQIHPVFEKRLDPRTQIWLSENLAAKWGLDPGDLGLLEMGWEMDPAKATRMRWPDKAALCDYLQRAYAAEEQALAVLDDQLFQEVSPSGKMLGYFLMEYLVHEWQHYGMMEYVLGLYQLNVPQSKATSSDQ